MILATDDPVAVEVTAAIHRGDTEALAALLRDHAQLSTSADRRRLLLAHAAPRAHRLARASSERRGDGRSAGRRGSRRRTRDSSVATPRPALHWAASCDDVDVLDALLDRGAGHRCRRSRDRRGHAIARCDCVRSVGCRASARRARCGDEALAGGDARIARPRRDRARRTAGDREEVTEAFWAACHGGHRATAERLLAEGAEINWVGWDDLTPLDAASREGADEVVAWLASIGGVDRAKLSSDGRLWTGAEGGLRFGACPPRNTTSRCSSASLRPARGPTPCSPTSSPATATSRTS